MCTRPAAARAPHFLPDEGDFSLLRSNAGLVAALAIGIHSDRVLMGSIGTKTRRGHSFIGFPETFSPRRSLLLLALASLHL
jgi:hypothetical protein